MQAHCTALYNLCIVKLNDMQNNEIALLNKFGIAKGSNFNYSESANAFLGIGEIKDLLIVEQIAEGTGCTYLCGI